MALTVTHLKTNNIAAWTQADLNAQIALGNYPPGTTLADITLSTDWNSNHVITGTADAAIGGTVTGGTAGSVLFIDPANTLAQDNANLFWDNANNRLGIGTNTPAVTFEVVTSNFDEARFRNITSTAYTSFRFLNNLNLDLYSVIFGFSGSATPAPLTGVGSVNQQAFLACAYADPLILGTDSTARIYIAGGTAFASDPAETKIAIGHAVPTAILHLRAGGTTANRAPLKFSSGSLNTSPEVGAVEFLTDKWYATITTGAARKEITLNDTALTATRLPFVTTNGRLTDSANVTYISGTGLIVGDNIKLNTVGNALYVKEGSGGFQGSVAMTSGVATVTIAGLTTADRAIAVKSVVGGTLGQGGYTVACTANTLTITSVNLAGVTNTLETSTYTYFITRPA